MRYVFLALSLILSVDIIAQTNPLWTEQKVKNYLPHMTTVEVSEFLKRSDMVIIPVAALEQHAAHLPIGTDFINAVETCKLIAQERDILVAPVLMAGQSPYHMGFAGTVTLSAETIIKVHMETVESLIRHGFKRFIIMAGHTGNTNIVDMIVDQVNQTTSGVAVNYADARKPFMERINAEPSQELDRHAGTFETSNSMYLMPTLVQLDKAVPATITLPPHMKALLPQVVGGDPTATLLFTSEGLKPEETGKKTSSAEMSSTGVYGTRDPKESTVEKGEDIVKNSVAATVKFIDKWNEVVKVK